MAIDDPRKRAVNQNDEVEELRDQIEELKALVNGMAKQQVSGGGISEASLEAMFTRVAQVSANAMEKAANPSNKTHPGISVYSYPEGDRVKPRTLKCPMFWVGYDLQPDTTTAYEIELLNQAEPGIFEFIRTDGSRDQLTVTGDRKPDGSYSRFLFQFMTAERKETLPSMVSMLQQAFGVQTPEQIELARVRAELDALKASRQTVAA